ncbi:MAG: MFS transporter [Planctomycetes bacterium]|nr:MFS transporter [Planctomycetota bacterium]
MTRDCSRAWGVVALMWVAYFLNYTDRQLVFSLFPVLRSELGFSDAQLGWVGTTFLWVYAGMSPLAGQIGDRISKRSLVVASLLLWSGATALTGMARSPAAVLACRALIGVVEGLFMPAAVALTATVHAPETRSRAIGVLSTAQLAGVVMGGSYGGWMAEGHHWRWAFYSLGIAGILYALPYRALLRSACDEPAPAPRASLSVVALARVPSYGVLCVVFPMFCFALWLVYSWLPDYFFERFRLTLGEAGFAATAYAQGATLAGMLAGGVCADRLYGRSKAARFRLLAAGLVIVAPSLFLVARAGSFGLAKAATAGFGFGCGLFMANIFPASFDVVPGSVRASAVGCLNLLGGLVAGGAAFLGGEYRRTIGIPTLLTVAGGLCLAGAALLALGVALFFRRDHERAREAKEDKQGNFSGG